MVIGACSGKARMVKLPDIPKRTIIIGVNKEEGSKRALEFYLNVMCDVELDHVYLCHFYEPPPLPFFSIKHPLNIPWQDWERALRERVETVNKFMNECQWLCERKRVSCTTFTSFTSPHKGLMELAKEVNASMIVIGKKSNLLEEILGKNVSSYVAHHCHIPVTLVI
ncbi:hypothetical protein RF11_15253 [Thelohanellus kitauei]|uniref:UspA domain-containing protein n=1 Tax=Thelohanellus kitauei TaxID=669202 RepID=A0A0C2MYR4_THEKT|nr:hypothetical protein RF11_15253 [Thelohanellus kitauei]